MMVEKMMSVLCLVVLVALSGAEKTVETSTMTCADVDILVETMDSNYNPTRYEREMIMKCLLPNYEQTEDPIDSSEATEWYELSTEPVTEEYVEVLEPSGEVVLPIKERSKEQFSVEEHPSYFGSTRSVPGFHFPNYMDIPQTSFSCVEKNFIPGFYADLETGCQVFHVCWPHRRESFLCPVGTTFNQALMTCDFWYNSNCSMAPHYYNVNAHSQYQEHRSNSETVVGSMIDTLIENSHHFGSSLDASAEHKTSGSHTATDISYISKFLPVKAKVTVYPETKDQKPKIVAEASVGKKKVKHPSGSTVKQSFIKFDKVPLDHSKEAAISDIIDEIFSVAKKIVQESREIASKVRFEKKIVKQMNPVVINPRFDTKPVEKASKESATTSLPKTAPRSNAHASEPRKLSPFTKKYLTESYMKLLKMKH